MLSLFFAYVRMEAVIGLAREYGLPTVYRETIRLMALPRYGGLGLERKVRARQAPEAPAPRP